MRAREAARHAADAFVSLVGQNKGCKIDFAYGALVSSLPPVSGSLLLRTAFSDEAAWQTVIREALRESEEGFTADLTPVNDANFNGVDWRGVRASVLETERHAAVLFIADETTLTSREHPVMVVDLLSGGAHPYPPFRCIPSELWAVENNLNIANLDWADFADAANEDGVYRGIAAPANESPTVPNDVERRGLAASHRLAANLLRGPAQQTVSGRRGTATASVVIHGTVANVYDLASRISFWITHAAIAHPIVVGGPYQINSYTSSASERTSALGGGTRVTGEYRQLAAPSDVEVSWNWHAPPPAGRFPREPQPHFLAWTTIVHLSVTPVAGPADQLSRLTVEHRDIPVEWADDLADFWAWNLDHARYLVESGLHKPTPKR